MAMIKAGKGLKGILRERGAAKRKKANEKERKEDTRIRRLEKQAKAERLKKVSKKRKSK